MSRKFNVVLSIQGGHENQIESNPVIIKLTPITPKKEKDYSFLDSVPVHDEKDVSDKIKPDCWLQIWELDFYKIDPLLVQEETDLNDFENRCLASFHGIIVKSKDKYSFRAFGENVFARDEESPLNGKILVKLTSGFNNPKTQDAIVHLPEYESVLELAAAIRLEDDRSFGAKKDLTPIFMQNIEASIRRQLAEREGIAVAFVSDFKGTNPEFHNQAEQMIRSLPTFILNDDDEIRMGYHTIGSYKEIAPKISELIDSISAKFNIEKELLLISNLSMYGHGIAQKLQIDFDKNNKDDYSRPGSLDCIKVHSFVNQIGPYLSDYIVITLNACACGRSHSAGPATGDPRYIDLRYGKPYPCEMFGEDSLGLTMFRDLAKLNLAYPCVWAHATAGHTTRNPNLRVFSNCGSADLPNILFKMRNLDIRAIHYGSPFAIPKKASDKSYKSKTHNANLLRRICQQNSIFFDWSWNTGTEGPQTMGYQIDQGESSFYPEDVNAILSQIGELFPNVPREIEDPLLYSDDSRNFIVGIVEGVEDTELSEDFSYSDISDLADPIYVSVTLMKMVQLLRNRTRKSKGIKGITLLTISSDGKIIALQPDPPNHANTLAISVKAQELLREGYISSTTLQQNIISIGV